MVIRLAPLSTLAASIGAALTAVALAGAAFAQAPIATPAGAPTDASETRGPAAPPTMPDAAADPMVTPTGDSSADMSGTDPEPEPGTGVVAYDPVAAMARFEALMNDQDYQAATEVTEAMVARTELKHGRDSAQLIEPLQALSKAYLASDAHREAQGSLSRAIGLLEDRDGIFNESLVAPLTDLARAHEEQGQYDEALSSYVRARHIVHRNYGVVDGEQLPLIDRLTELHIAMGDLHDANREQKLAYRITRTNCGDDTFCRVDGIFKLAHWYERLNRFTVARGLYRDALKDLEARAGPDDPSLVPALRGIAKTYERQAQHFGDGRRALERAVNILDAQPYVDSIEHVEAFLQLGDWYNLINDHENAAAAYARAWQIRVASGVDAQSADQDFAKPRQLRYRPPTPDESDPAWRESRLKGAYVVVRFDVDQNGRVKNAEVDDATASARVRREVRDAIRRAKYRPRLAGGQVVATESVRIRQSFEYITPYQAERRRREALRRAASPRCVGPSCSSSVASYRRPEPIIVDTDSVSHIYDGTVGPPSPGSEPAAGDGSGEPAPASDGAAVAEEVP